MAGVRAGETFVSGRHPDTARSLLAAADRAGVPQELVRATVAGYIVPDAVADALDPPDPDAGF